MCASSCRVCPSRVIVAAVGLGLIVETYLLLKFCTRESPLVYTRYAPDTLVRSVVDVLRVFGFCVVAPHSPGDAMCWACPSDTVEICSRSKQTSESQ